MLDPCLVVTIVRKGWGDAVLEATMRAGAQGGTVMIGRGIGRNETMRVFGIQIEPEKEIVLTVIRSDQKVEILRAVESAAELDAPGKGLAFVVPVENIIGIAHLLRETPPTREL